LIHKRKKGRSQLKKIRKYSVQQKKELKKYSYAFVLLKILTGILFLITILVFGIKLSFLNINQGLIILLGSLVSVYFAIPLMAAKVINSFIVFTPKKRLAK